MLFYLRVKERLLTPERPGRQIMILQMEQRRGKRHWLQCPLCRRPKGKLYGFTVDASEVVGCRSCLGLTYLSRARHRCLDHDQRVLKSGASASTNTYLRACNRERSRLAKFYVERRRFLERHRADSHADF